MDKAFVMPSTLDIIYEISSVRRTTLIHLCSQVAKVGKISTTIFSIGEYFLNVFTEDRGRGAAGVSGQLN